MTALTAPPIGRGSLGSADWSTRLAFLASVAVVLTFTEFWLMPLTGPNGDPEASGLIRTLYLPAYAIALVLVAWRPLETLRSAVRSPILWLLVGYTFVSMLWSVDPETTQRRAIALLFTTIGAVVVAARWRWPALMEVFASAFAVVVVCSYALALALPSYGKMQELFPGAWRGVFQEKNTLGDHMTIGFMVFVSAAVLNPPRRWLWCGFAALALGLVLFSTSKTSLVTLVIGAGCLGIVWLARRGPAMGVATVFIAVSGLVALALAIVFAPDAFFAVLGKDATFTGRTVIWQSVLRLIQQRPWTGFGYGAIWTDESGWGPLAWIIKWSHFRPHHAHNSWLETWLALGYGGLAIWLVYFLEIWGRTLWSVFTNKGAYFALPFLAVYTLTTLTESVAFIYNDLDWVILAATGIRLAAPRDGDEAATLVGAP